MRLKQISAQKGSGKDKEKGTRRLNIAFVSTYLPTQCGIAKFTYSLNIALASFDSAGTHIIRIIVPDDTKLRERNIFPVKKQERESYLSAAEFINGSEIDVVNVQHEYGIFGGTWGSYILDFMKNVKKPIVTVLHTLEPALPPDKAEVFRQVWQLSSRVIITMPLTSRVLKQRYGIEDSSKVVFIPHGVPRIDERLRENAKRKMGLVGKYVMVSFGLINRSKGFEYAIDALPEILKRHSNFVYLIIGKTHPVVRKKEGDAYLNMLKEKARELGVQDHVRFIEKFFLSEQELSEHIMAGDIFVAPYMAKNQISSGTMVYAMAHKLCVITTPFTHARKEISGKIGYLIRHRNSDMIAKAVNSLLDSPTKLRTMQDNAYKHVKDRQWPKVAERYLELFREVSLENSKF